MFYYLEESTHVYGEDMDRGMGGNIIIISSLMSIALGLQGWFFCNTSSFPINNTTYISL